MISPASLPAMGSGWANVPNGTGHAGRKTAKGKTMPLSNTPELDTVLDRHMRTIETTSRGIERARCQRIAIQVCDFAAQNPKLTPEERKHCAATAAQIAALIEGISDIDKAVKEFVTL